MRSLTLATKVQLLLALALLFTGAVSAAGFAVASSLGGVIRSYTEAEIPALQALAGVATHVAEAVGHAAAVESQDADEPTHAAAMKALRAAAAVAREGASAYEAVPHSAAESARWSEARRAFDRWVGSMDGLEKAAAERAAKADDFAAAAAAQHDVTKSFNEARGAGEALVTAIQAAAAATQEASAALGAQAAQTQSASRLGLAIAFLLAAGILAGGGAYLAAGTRRTVDALKAQSRELRDAVAAGRLDVRAGGARLGAEFAPIIDGMNETMDAIQRPLRMVVEVTGRLGRGDLPAPVAERFAGDFERIKESLNGSIAAVNALVADTRTLAQAGVEGRLEVRADAGRHQGDFRTVVQGVNDTLDAVVGPVRMAAAAVDALSHGNVPPRIETAYRGEFQVIRDNLNRCIDAVQLLVTDTNALAEAGAAGRLATRADAQRHQGDFRRVVEGVNRTLDAVTSPLEVAAHSVAELAAGRVPPPIAQPWQGDFARLRENLNTCLEAVNKLVTDTEGLVAAATAGQLGHRADAGRHQGDFARIVEGVNRTLDAVTAPVAEGTAVLERLAAKELHARMAGSYQGDHDRLKQAINATAGALQEAMLQVAHAVEQVSGAAAQIASSSQAVASGASQQASSLAQTTASIEEVAGMTRRAADSAQQADGLAASARAAAGAGATAVEQLQGAMVSIRQSADRTGQIIKDVSEIAFQTNLLALNAAVEAARAGEAGRGFAVVAEEVRSLALRAKEAAQKTEELIRESVRQAGQGEAAAGQVSGRLGEIVQGVSRVSEIVAAIAASAREQASGIAQVSTAVGEMDKVTQQNAASAEESSSAASELNAQAEELASMVSTFRLEASAAPAPQRALSPRRTARDSPASHPTP